MERNSWMAMAMTRNKAEQNCLAIELKNIEKQKADVAKHLHNEKQKLRSKYSKTNAFSLYYKETISSGCDIRESPNAQTTNTEYFGQLHNILFSNDEIDVEKLLCLHLISAHRAETLTPMKKKHPHICKIHSPVERLLERSSIRNYRSDQRLANLLPLYTLEMVETGGMGEQQRPPIKDGRLATRVLINRNLRELVNTVLIALQPSNPEKCRQILRLACDPTKLKEIFANPEIRGVLDTLSNNPLVTSCDSYVLSPPFKTKSTQIQVATFDGAVECFIRNIRRNVLQAANRRESKVGSEASVAIGEGRIESEASVLTRNMEKGAWPSWRGPDEDTGRRGSGSGETEKLLSGTSPRNFVKKNIKNASKTKRIEYENQDEENQRSPRGSKTRRRSSGSFAADTTGNQTARSLSIITENLDVWCPEHHDAEQHEHHHQHYDEDEEEEEEEEKKNTTRNPWDRDPDVDYDPKRSRRRSSGSEDVRYTLKQTTCPACMERYRTRLPAPKTPRVRRESVLPPEQTPVLKTDSQHRIRMLINKEMYNLASYDRRFSSANNSRRTSLNRKDIENLSDERVTLTPVELARIEQEIREKETQKKLHKFLDGS